MHTEYTSEVDYHHFNEDGLKVVIVKQVGYPYMRARQENVVQSIPFD